MVFGQNQLLLRNCFQRRADGSYDPVMIQMSLMKSFINHDKQPGDADYIEVQRLDFQLPLICIIPLNSLVIDKVTVDSRYGNYFRQFRGKATDDRVLRKPAQLNGKIASSNDDSKVNTKKQQQQPP